MELPRDRVAEKRAEVLAALSMCGRRARDEAYAHTVFNVGSAAALAANMVFDEDRRLRRRLKAVIVLDRCLVVLAGGCLIAAAVLRALPLLAIAIAFGLVEYFVTNRLQTKTNVEIASRTEVFCEMVASDPEFREEAVAVVRQKHGDVAAENLGALWEQLGR